MLDTESEQIREVYAVFGLAMYQAQNLEVALATLLAVFGDSRLMTAWDYDARFAESFESTFGTLVANFAKISNPEQEKLLRQLEKAVEDRNSLAHHYFWERAAHLCASEGRAQMITELVTIGENFDSLDRELSELAREIVERRGLTKEILQAHTAAAMEELLSGATKPYRPDRVPKLIEIVGAYEWRTDSIKSKLIMTSKSGRYLLLGERGLCYGPQNIPTNELVEKTEFKRALPAPVNPRPRKSEPWNYAIALANGYILCVRPDEVSGRSVCRFGLRRLKQLIPR